MPSSPMMDTFKAVDADLVNKQFRAVKLTADRTVDFSTAATDLSIGILQNKPAAAGRDAVVTMRGPSKAVLGGTVSAGQFLVPNSDGDLVAVTLGATSSNVAVARAMVDGADNDVIDVDVNVQQIQI